MTVGFGSVVALAAAAGLGCCGTASAFVVPPSAALFCEGARYFGGLFRVLPLARRKSSVALLSRAGLRGARGARGRRRTDKLTCLAPPVWHAGVKTVRAVALPGFRASAEDQAEGLAADLSRRSALAV